MLGKTEGNRREWQRMKWLDGIISSIDTSVSKLREIVKDREAWRAVVHGVPKSWTRLSNWTITKNLMGDMETLKNLHSHWWVNSILLLLQFLSSFWIHTEKSDDALGQWHPTLVLLAGKSHGWRSLVGYSPWGRWESDTTEWLHFHFSLLCIGEENGNPLQCSCLENPRDRGAWWAAVYGVAQSRTRLKRLSSNSSFILQALGIYCFPGLICLACFLCLSFNTKQSTQALSIPRNYP